VAQPPSAPVVACGHDQAAKEAAAANAPALGGEQPRELTTFSPVSGKTAIVGRTHQA
jgi:hypothetical protein